MNPRQHLFLAPAAGLLLSLCATTFAAEPESTESLQREKAVLEKRLGEINSKLGVSCLGLILVERTEALMKEYRVPENSGPIILAVRDGSYFMDGTAPTPGCAFWIVEHPGRMYFFNHETSPSRMPRNIRELAQAILVYTITPEEHQKLLDESARECRKHAEALNDRPDEQKRLRKIADSLVMPKGDVGKHICRVVYNYPGTQGTMTTYLRLTQSDLEQLRRLAKN